MIPDIQVSLSHDDITKDEIDKKFIAAFERFSDLLGKYEWSSKERFFEKRIESAWFKEVESHVSRPIESAWFKEVESHVSRPIESAWFKEVESHVSRPIESAWFKEVAICQPLERPEFKLPGIYERVEVGTQALGTVLFWITPEIQTATRYKFRRGFEIEWLGRDIIDHSWVKIFERPSRPILDLMFVEPSPYPKLHDVVVPDRIRRFIALKRKLDKGELLNDREFQQLIKSRKYAKKKGDRFLEHLTAQIEESYFSLLIQKGKELHEYRERIWNTLHKKHPHKYVLISPGMHFIANSEQEARRIAQEKLPAWEVRTIEKIEEIPPYAGKRIR